jgi:hypothetical protein
MLGRATPAAKVWVQRLVSSMRRNMPGRWFMVAEWSEFSVGVNLGLGLRKVDGHQQNGLA